jgi:lysozyme
MKLSKSGLQKIVDREGKFLHAYRDTTGVWTIGVGHTSAAGPPAVRPGMLISLDQMDSILLADLAPIERQAAQYIKVPITQNQYDAIISIVFNVGPKFWKSTTIRLLNEKKYKGAAEAIMMWNKPPEIIGRRRSEQKQFLTPDIPLVSPPIVVATKPITVHPYVAAGTVGFGIIAAIWYALHLWK